MHDRVVVVGDEADGFVFVDLFGEFECCFGKSLLVGFCFFFKEI
jgi:hypothetical protein